MSFNAACNLVCCSHILYCRLAWRCSTFDSWELFLPQFKWYLLKLFLRRILTCFCLVTALTIWERGVSGPHWCRSPHLYSRQGRGSLCLMVMASAPYWISINSQSGFRRLLRAGWGVLPWNCIETQDISALNAEVVDAYCKRCFSSAQIFNHDAMESTSSESSNESAPAASPAELTTVVID